MPTGRDHARFHALVAMGLLSLLAFMTMSASSQITPKPKPISHYMREVGLIYIEQIEDFERKCTDAIDSCDSAMNNQWDKTFRALEDRIELTLSEGKRPAGDKPFFNLLKVAKDQKYLYLLALQRASYHFTPEELQQGGLQADESERARNAVERFARTSSNCHARARVDIQYGSYSAGDDDCHNVPRADYTAPISPHSEYAGKEAEARSWKTQASCERKGFTWAEGVCHPN